jgi:presqualene diphosphate synthase
MASVYSDILDRIERQGFAPPRRRVSLSKARLLLSVLRHGVF